MGHRRRVARVNAIAAALLLFTASQHALAGPDQAAIGDWGIALEHIDPAVRPGDDFFRYSNGEWMKHAAIPADMPAWGYGPQLALNAEADVQAIIAELATRRHAPGSVEQKVGDLFASWTDVERLEALGATPLRPHLRAIAAIESRDDLLDFFADPGHVAPFGIGIIADPADPRRYTVTVSQGGLGMPSRDYYLQEGTPYDGHRTAYADYIARMFELAGIPGGKEKAARILALETRLAKTHWAPEESRDIQKVYNPMDVAGLAALAPQFEWPRMFARLGLGGIGTLVVGETTALQAAGRIYEEAPLQDWKDYLAFHFIRGKSAMLSSAFDRATFDFYSKTLNGIAEQRPREKRGVQLISGAMGDAVGQVYVAKHFPPASKRMVEELVGDLTAAFRERLQRLEWMDEATRDQALAKLDAFEARVGYPEKWIDYSKLRIERNDLFANSIALQDFYWQLMLDRLGKPVDRDLWGMTPQTVNAYYSPLMNQITFPAAILQPPMFDPAADPAVNYGTIGAVIGHEIGHGFDDQGRRFDASGRLRDWWTVEANARFTALTKQLGDQYAQYEPVPGTRINSALTMGENIGDLGGLEMAYSAYQRYLARCCGGKAPVIDGLDGDQRFFLAFAAGWQRIAREDFTRQHLKTDPHSPPEFRVNGVVRNMDAWYRAFDVKPGDALYLAPEKRVRIW